MPRGPQGRWRPADPVAAGVHIAKLATGEIVETQDPPASTRSPREASQQAKKANAARNAKLSPERRREIAKAGADARWGAR
jgi:hypothetical protein